MTFIKKYHILAGLMIGSILSQQITQAKITSQIVDMPVYISQVQGDPTVVLGQLTELDEISIYEYPYTSINIKQHDEMDEQLAQLKRSDVESVQFNINITDQSINKKYWRGFIEEVVGINKQVYLNIQPEHQATSRKAYRLEEASTVVVYGPVDINRTSEQELEPFNVDETTQGTELESNHYALEEILSIEEVKDFEEYTELQEKIRIEQENTQQLIELLEKELEALESEDVVFLQTVSSMEEVEQVLGEGVREIHVEVQYIEDLLLLEAIYQDYRNQIKVIVTDCITQNTDLAQDEQIALINRLYYDLPVKYPNVQILYADTTSQLQNNELDNLYQRVLGQSWIEPTIYEDEGIAVRLTDRVTMVNEETLQVFLPVEDENIEYVEYKFNGGIIGRSTQYPYAITIDPTTMYKGNNELRTVIKYKDTEVLDVDVCYLESDLERAVGERALRTTPTYTVDQQMSYTTGYIPVLMYHKFRDIVPPDSAAQSGSVSTQLFDEQLTKLTEEGYTAITFLDYINYLNGTGGLPEKPYIVTSDDGYMDNYTHGYPILKAHNIPATFFVTSQYVGVKTYNDHFSWDQAREMEQSGLIDIQNHTAHHYLVSTLDEEEANYEVNRTYGQIERELGKRDVKVFSYPQFAHNQETQQWLIEWGAQFQTTNLAREGTVNDSFDIKRIHVHNNLSADALIEEIKRLTE